MPLILGGSAATAAAGFSVDNSCRFDRDSSTYMDKTLGTPTSQTTFTFSCWFKRANKISTNMFTAGWGDTGANYGYLNAPNSSNKYDFYLDDGNGGNLMSNRLFRDYSAWYNVVCRYDTTEGASDDRIRVYVNGIEETSFYEERTVDEDRAVLGLASGQTISVGDYTGGNNYFDGYIAEFCYIDGLALAPTSFGEFDEDSPTIWKPIDVSGLTFGNNGFYLDFEDSANLGNDANGGTDLTEYNLAAIDQTTDTPTNNFSTMNPMDNYLAGSTFTEGNLKIVTSSTPTTFNTGTMGLSSGKWYYEVLNVVSSSGNKNLIGITGVPSDATGNHLGENAYSYGYYGNDGDISTSLGDITYGDAYANDDLVGVYIDLDNSKLYFALNGTIQNSGTGFDITAVASTREGVYLPAVGDRISGTPNANFEVNFGNPVAALTSAVADVNGYGNFEYSPNDGGSASFDGSAKDFLAICTKNLGSDGG